MKPTPVKWMCLATTAIVLVMAQAAFSASENLGNGFRHHGVATPVSNHRGTVATVDGSGRNVVLVWLFDHRGGYALLMIDAETGKSEQFPVPFPPGGDCPYTSILSSANKFYTHFNSHFVEFDPVKRAFTFHHKTAPQMAMSMTEDDRGVLWSVTYPQSGIVSFDPETGEFKDYGQVYKQNWCQYPRSVAADDAGWIYFGIGSTASQIIQFNPDSAEAKPLVPEGDRVHGSGSVYRDLNGKVYGHAGGNGGKWHELYKGQSRTITPAPNIRKKPIITSSQGLFHRDFPDGRRLLTCDLVDRILEVEDPKTKQTEKLSFDYDSEGAHIMGLAVAPDETICGGTAFPMRFFRYEPKNDTWTNHACHGQWNTVARQGDRFFAGCYGHGVLLQWDPARTWVPTENGSAKSNPLFLAESHPTINRPHDLLAYPDGKTLVLAGTPGYGLTGGGLLFWNRETKTRTLLEQTDVLPQQATMSLAPLPNGKLLGGSTTRPGTGGEKKAAEAELYILDMTTGQVEWHDALFSGVQNYTDLVATESGLVYGFADRKLFFVFDPAKRKIVHQQETKSVFGWSTSQQGPRVFVVSPDGTVHILFVKGIARIDSDTFDITMVAESPVPIGPGGDILEGRIYFASGSHLYSYEIP